MLMFIMAGTASLIKCKRKIDKALLVQEQGHFLRPTIYIKQTIVEKKRDRGRVEIELKEKK